MKTLLIILAPLLALSLASCNEEEVFGSCLRTGDADTGVVASCQDYLRPSSDKDALETACNESSDSTWSDAPCDTANHCGYCETNVPNDGFHGKYYYFDTEGLENSESEYEESCLSGGANTWVDNPSVTCQ